MTIQRSQCTWQAWGVWRGVAGLTVALTAGNVIGDILELTPEKDNTLFESVDGTLSNGAGPSIFVGKTGLFGGGLLKRGVLSFDLSALPDAARVDGVSLTLEVVQTSGMGISALNGLHRATADWGEGTSVSLAGIGAPATPGDATWLHTFFPDDTWLSPGGDFVATPSSVQLVGLELGSYTWGDTPQLRADIESWRADPSQNFGWVLIGDEVTEFSAKRFASRESLVPGALPVLRIDFDPCPADCGNDDGMVDIVDLLALLAEWGMPGSCDIDGSGVAITDLLALLAAWGECT